MINFYNIEEELDFIEAINEIKSLILLFKDNYNNQELSDDLDYLATKMVAVGH